jgi:hypothetical protein
LRPIISSELARVTTSRTGPKVVATSDAATVLEVLIPQLGTVRVASCVERAGMEEVQGELDSIRVKNTSTAANDNSHP